MATLEELEAGLRKAHAAGNADHARRFADAIRQQRSGQIAPGNIDLKNRPRVRNADGSISTVRSMSANFDGREVLIPTVSDDGRILTDEQAIDAYRRTGRHLGMFASPEAATRYAEQLHRDQERMYAPKQRITAEQARDPSLIPEERYRAAGMEPPKRGSGSSGNRYGDYLAGVGKSIVDTASGVRQYAVDAAGDPANALGPLGKPLLRAIAGDRFDAAAAKSPTLQGVRNYGQRLRNEEAERRQVLPSVSEDPAFALGNVVGTLGQLFTPGAALRGTTAGRAALPTTAGGNALQGLALGTVQPVAGRGERDVNQAVGGLAGWLGAAVPQAVGAATRPVRSAIGDLLGQPTASGVERRAADLIRQEAADVGSLMRPAPSAVPGVQRTLAEESLDPGVARLERQLRGSGPAGVFAPIDQANAAARVRSIEEIAGTDAQMAAANQARTEASQSARSQAMEAGPVDVSQTILALEDAIKAQEGRPAVQAGLRQVRDLLFRERMAGPGTVVGAPEDRITVLENVRQTIGDMLGGRYGGDNAAALQGSRELIGVRDSLNREIGDQVPAFVQYLDAYRQGSVPINRMEIGRELLDRSSAAVAGADNFGTGVRPLLPASYSRQVNNLDALAARATGFDKARADQILTPDDIAKIRAVQDDLERQAFRATAGSGGNSMTQERQALARRMGRSAIQSVPVVGRFAESLEAMGEKRLNDTLARLIANPEEARRVLSTLNAKDRAVVNKALLQISARTGAAVPALAE